MIRTLWEGWKLAIGTLTIFPSGAVTITPTIARVMVALAPVAMFGPALVAGGIGWVGVRFGLPGLVTGLCVVGVLALSNRAMHWDGLADITDGLGGGWTPERAREILRRGDIGPMGVITLIITLGLQSASIGAVLTHSGGVVMLIIAVLFSRMLFGFACTTGRVAMPGSRLGAGLVGVVPRWQVWLGIGVGIGALSGAAISAGWPWWQGAVAGSAAVIAAIIVLARCERRFEGVNGDVLGALIEIGLTTMVVVLAVGI